MQTHRLTHPMTMLVAAAALLFTGHALAANSARANKSA